MCPNSPQQPHEYTLPLQLLTLFIVIKCMTHVPPTPSKGVLNSQVDIPSQGIQSLLVQFGPIAKGHEVTQLFYCVNIIQKILCYSNRV